jgi:CubicO group peptidase (beta-lactamase class C family)
VRRIRLVVMLAAPVSLGAQQLDSAAIAARADRVLAAAAGPAAPAPGCAVGIARNGRPVYERAFGMADIEFGIPNTPQTVFESGSVAKQFTAASIVLLALEGKLRLDDAVRKYVPELPDYGVPLTIRHLLNHTSGIRDWGSPLELTGFGRGERVVTQALAFDVIVHQRGLDFTPGAEYSYSNSGYTLLATIVERISKQTLPVFTSQRFFVPLGMSHSSWRDDYTRLVAGRAQAYARAGATGWKLDMPFMNVYGNGGMLTTVGDWLKWNAMLEARSMGGALVDSLERRGKLNDGREISYALGLTVNTYKGKRQVAHSGATAGYNTYLTRFPELALSVAVLCNASATSPTQLALRLVDEIAGPLPAPPPPDTITLPTAELQKRVALWRDVNTHLPAQTVLENGALRVMGGAVLRPLRDGAFLAAQGPIRWQFELGPDGKPAKATRLAGDAEEHFVVETPWTPTAAELAEFAGEWHSDEADATFTFALENGRAILRQRPAMQLALRPLYRDHFGPVQGNGQVIWFTRGGSGRASLMHVGASRMRDMPFSRVGAR